MKLRAENIACQKAVRTPKGAEDGHTNDSNPMVPWPEWMASAAGIAPDMLRKISRYL